MYVSGTVGTFRNRLHQFARTEADLLNLQAEAISYAGVFSVIEQGKLNREARKRVPAFTGDLFDAGEDIPLITNDDEAILTDHDVEIRV